MDIQSIKVACSSCNLRELCLPMGLNPDEMDKLDSGWRAQLETTPPPTSSLAANTA